MCGKFSRIVHEIVRFYRIDVTLLCFKLKNGWLVYYRLDKKWCLRTVFTFSSSNICVPRRKRLHRAPLSFGKLLQFFIIPSVHSETRVWYLILHGTHIQRNRPRSVLRTFFTKHERHPSVQLSQKRAARRMIWNLIKTAIYSTGQA